MYHVAWLAKRNPFHDRKIFADACASGSASSVNLPVAWEVDYLQFLFRDAQWHWIDDARKIAPLRPDVVVFMSNDFAFAGYGWTPKILVHLSDEWGRTPMFHRVTEHIPLVLRQYRFEHYYRPPNVRHIPLGFMACMFDDPKAIGTPDLCAHRRYKWSFVGSVRPERASAIAAFSAWSPHWYGGCAPSELRDIYTSSEFVLCPRGHVRLDCFRNYEATMCGAVPVVAGCSKKEYAETFGDSGNPPWVFSETWDAALVICRNLVESGTVAALRKENTLWWSSEIQSLHEAIRSALDGR